MLSSRLKHRLFPLLLLLAMGASGCATADKTKGSTSPVASAEKTLTLVTTAGESHVFNLENLERKFKMSEFEVKSNPAYQGAMKRYQGFDLASLLRSLDAKVASGSQKFQIEVTTLDGWKAPPYSADIIFKGKAFLAVRESASTLTEPISDDRLWSLVVTPQKQMYPGPFYLLWNDNGKNPDVLPFQVKTIKLTAF